MSYLDKIKTGQKITMIVGAVVAIIAGIAFTFGGILIINDSNKVLGETTGTITSIEENYDADSGVFYDVYVSYTVDGKDYNGVYGEYNSGMKVNDEVIVKYDVSDPTNIYTSGSTLFGIVFIIVGLISAGVAVRNVVLLVKDKDEEDDEEVIETKHKELEVDERDEEKQEYLFHFTQGIKQGYVMKDSARNIVYEAKMIKLTFFKPFTYDFINHLTGNTTTRKIGHVITTSTSVGINNLAASIINKKFTIDGVQNWEYLKNKGFDLDVEINGLDITYTVFKNDKVVAVLKPAGTNEMTGKNYKLGNIATNGILKVECYKSDLEMIFMMCFSISQAGPMSN